MTIPNNWLVESGGVLYFGGTAPVDGTNTIVGPDDPGAQTEQILKRYQDALTKQGLGLENLAFVTIYLKNLDDYGLMNEVYGKILPEPFPARKVIQAPMTLAGMVVEMTAIAPREVKKVL